MHSPICHACRDDVSRLVKNPALIPRLAKEKLKENCINQTCTGIDLHYSTTISVDELAELGFDIPNILPTTVPLCKHHYFLAKNKQAKHRPIAQCATLALKMLQ